MLNLDSIVSYREDIDTTDIDGDKVMMDLEKGQYFALNSEYGKKYNHLLKYLK